MWKATWTTMRDWLGFGPGGHSADHRHGHGHGHSHHGAASHTHGVVDPVIATTERGIQAIKWSFVILAATALLQIGVYFLSGSVALLADTIHNIGDAASAIPLWIAFLFARRKPTERFNYGLGRLEDLAGIVIVALILFSAVVAALQAIDRLVEPREIAYLGAVAAAGVIGFIGNEVVAVLRIRVGREIQSAALVADGYHARVDGLTSLAVVGGAAGVALGFPLADPLVGLAITAMIFGIVWQSARAVFTRALDGVEPDVPLLLRHAAEHVPGIRGLQGVRTRWLGHRLYAEADIVVDDALLAREIKVLAERLQTAARRHLPALASLRVGIADRIDEEEQLRARSAPVPAHDHGGGHSHGGHDHGAGHHAH